MNIVHAKRFRAVQAVFHLAHGFKGALVGRKQTPEARATLTQARLQLFLSGQFLRGRFPRLLPPYPVSQIFEERHLYTAERTASSILMMSSLMDTGLSM